MRQLCRSSVRRPKAEVEMALGNAFQVGLAKFFLSLITCKEESNVKERLRVRGKGSYRKGRRLMGEQEGEEHLGGSKEILRKPLDGGHRIRCLLKSSSAYNW